MVLIVIPEIVVEIIVPVIVVVHETIGLLEFVKILISIA